MNLLELSTREAGEGVKLGVKRSETPGIASKIIKVRGAAAGRIIKNVL